MIGHFLAKEKCSHCKMFVNIGQPVIECASCNTVIHAKCFCSSSFVNLNDENYCGVCSVSIEKRYNPFRSICNSMANGGDSLPDEGYDELLKASRMLQNCVAYDVDKFNTLDKSNFINHISLYFLNIDGNRTNFDQLILELDRYKHSPSIIGIAETNVDSHVCEVYQIPGYYFITAFIRTLNQGKVKVVV